MNRPRINRQRIYAGWLCLAIAFALVVALGLGVIDPVGMSTTTGAISLSAILIGLLPSVLLAVVIFGIGLWLLKGGRKS